MPDIVLSEFITVGDVKYPRGSVVEVPAESRDWLIGCGHIESTDAQPDPPKGPDMTDAAAAAIAELGLNALAIPGTGSGGRITKGDVDAYLAERDAGEGGDA